MRRIAAAVVAAAVAVTLMAAAPDPAERLPDPGQEAHARHLMRQFRCVVCQNESIDDSDADLASDLRRSVRELVRAGRSDSQIRHFMQARYGDFILLEPPFNPGNALLWLTPVAVLLIAGGAILLLRRRNPDAEAALNEDEEARLARLVLGADPPAAEAQAGPDESPLTER
jgi:cytochrome c-type biogenesis protein CcmH